MLDSFPGSRRTTKIIQTVNNSMLLSKNVVADLRKNLHKPLSIFREWNLTGEIKEQLLDFIHLSILNLRSQQEFSNFTVLSFSE